MDAKSEPREKAVDREFVIARVFNAPRELVWKAWAERERLMQWFGPKGFTMPIAKMDFRPGGTFHYCLRSADGKEMWGKFVYREIVAPERIVLVNSFSDENGNLTRHPFSASWPFGNAYHDDVRRGKRKNNRYGAMDSAECDERGAHDL